MKQIRWGVAATGNIARSVLADRDLVPDATFVAVGSRSQDRARAFADEHGIPRAYGSYRELIEDDEVDVIYIATPHPQHHQLALAAIEAGKHLLVEKAFTVTLAGAREVVEAARAAGTFCMEAMWTRFQPATRKLHELVDEGALGEVRGAQGDLTTHFPFDASHRLFDPTLGGGALLDLGVYPISCAHDFLGPVTDVRATGRLVSTGVDGTAAVQLSHANGAVSSLYCSAEVSGAGRFTLHGTEGWAELVPQFHHSQAVVLHRDGEEQVTFDCPRTGRGYAHELAEVTSRVLAGHTESELMPLEDTLAVMETLTAALGQLGVEYAEDDSVLETA